MLSNRYTHICFMPLLLVQNTGSAFLPRYFGREGRFIRGHMTLLFEISDIRRDTVGDNNCSGFSQSGNGTISDDISV